MMNISNACILMLEVELQRLICLLQPYVIALDLDEVFVTETWFNQNITDGDVEIAGFQCYRKDR